MIFTVLLIVVALQEGCTVAQAWRENTSELPLSPAHSFCSPYLGAECCLLSDHQVMLWVCALHDTWGGELHFTPSHPLLCLKLRPFILFPRGLCTYSDKCCQSEKKLLASQCHLYLLVGTEHFAETGSLNPSKVQYVLNKYKL